ncbi:piezo-type mechanosensitive ion channel component isoform X1 [Vespula pensylvanica]|uniref:piezo-type mechanosensitive ion channel component isoform X1 n=1 Tax=Vespula pensylvanica TaxID=30213 RepID=UPI001CBA033E|nr:piezo-type mechanosensitive ion channel component isoform X1 [Vespula pensylvanica]
MTAYWFNVILFRVFFPAVLAGCTIWRPVGLSLVYLGLMLYSPMVPTPTSKTMSGHTGLYLKASICLCFLVAITQLTFHIVLLAMLPYGHFLQDCQFMEKLFRHIGLVKLDNTSVWEVFYWLTPELILLPTTIITYVACRFLTQSKPSDDEGEVSVQRLNDSAKKTEDRTTKIINFFGHIGTYVVLASLCCTASLKPSVEGAFYFLVFLGAATWWACNRELRKGFAIICKIVMVVVIVHILALLSYQNQWPQELIPVNSTWSRYFALTAIYHTNCSRPTYVEYADKSDWLPYGYALRLFWLYYVLALQSRFLSKKPAKKVARLSGKLENLDTPLSRHVSIRRRTPSQRWQSARRKARRPIIDTSTTIPDERTPLMRFGSGRTGLLQDSTGSVIIQDGHQDDGIQLQSLSDGVPGDNPGIFEHIIMAVYSIFQLLINSSYLAMNIIMMTWSIMYHSWMTFALLLWALILWMMSNKRASMMKCSPFIVFYSTLLLLGQYVYSMDLTEEELPTTVNGIKISEIGFSKAQELSRWHLIVKCSFMLIFWITMRQYTAEWKQQRRLSTLRDMVAPLHVSVTTATTAMNYEVQEVKSKFMEDVGIILKQLLTKFWIAVVAIMLFICGITGERMTVFRIIYMSLFLFFVITFQISWLVWRKVMYTFWITVIGYSVIMLILVYTYQFQNFPEYWNYLGINKQLQMDIGLEIYETKDFFVRLLIPTFFVIITVVQMHYFHNDFLKITTIDKLGSESALRRSSLGHNPSLNPSTTSPTEIILGEEETSNVYTLNQLKRMSRLEKIEFIRNLMNHIYNFYNYTWLFLEIHMQKIIFISLILLCISDVCAINFLFVLAIVIVINFNRNIQIMSINIIVAIIALLMVTKMLYQIKYIDHSNWNVNCTKEVNENIGKYASNDTVYNIAEWFGIKKGEPGHLAELLKGYIGIVTVTTLRKIIRIRQWFFRQKKGESLDTPQVMFPNIVRADADKGIPECLKFLFNYGFYKFGLEICLIGIVALIGMRLDFYSVLYGCWLLLFFLLKRKTISRIWPFFKTFAIISLPVQYALVVAPPTWFCIEYPWSHSEMLRRLQEWMYFPDPDFPPNPKKLICDFLLLMMISRQSLVFNIEQNILTSGQEFVAGHNFSVYQNMDNPNFINPVKDYVSHIHSWLDVFKRGSMMSLMWITLSIMFLAGTKRTNLFSLGYLICAFVLLWQGSDFYLRPVRTILNWWKMLLGYNVIVIFSKSLLQGVGCVLIQELQDSACWLIQLLGIACLKKFHSATDNLGIGGDTCQIPREDIGMVWDGLCFGFLLIQLRFFKSYYFFHIVDETKAMSILASRGAELLEELHQKRIKIQDNVEKAILQKLKHKMDKIKANQRKIQGPSYREPETHQIDTLYPGTRPLYRVRVPKTNREAIRSGDYYMFDDLDDDDITDIVADTEIERKEAEQLPEDIRDERMTIMELMDTLIKTDIAIATHVAMYGGSKKDALRLRRRSVPLTRKKSSMSYLSARSENETAVPTDVADRTSITSEEIESEEKELATVDLTKPPPSEDEREEEDKTLERSVEEDDEKAKKVSVSTYFQFVWVIINSTLISMTKYLNQFSRDYRYIRKILAMEKKILKEKSDFRTGFRLGINQMWQPIPLVQERSTTNEDTEGANNPGEGPSQQQSPRVERKENSLTVPHIRILAPSLERGLNKSSSRYVYTVPELSFKCAFNIDDLQKLIKEYTFVFCKFVSKNNVKLKAVPDPRILSARSVIFSQMSQDQVEEEVAELSEVDQPPIIQLAASIWFGILAHSSLLCYFMVFLHQIKNASVISTPLPLMVFCWGSLTIPRPSKTFWVTLIAYTEAIVIMKCIFQLELIPWNRKAASSHPLFGPRIIGVERQRNYALWDLLLLLMVFFHRFMLKSLGQWTSPSIKPRKIIPSNLTVVESKPPDPPSGDGQAEESTTSWQQETAEASGIIRTPKGQILNINDKTDSQNRAVTVNENEKLVAIQGEEIHPYKENISTTMNLTFNKYLEPMKKFFTKILSPVGKEKTNVYAYMFLCDFFNFLLLIFGFSAFGTQQGDGGVTAYLQENRVPMPFLLMLLLQFALIVIDRALFLRKSIVGKLIFQYCLIFGVHMWMFFILPSVTERQFNDKLPPQIWYMMKCFYLLLAAYQLRQGYPTRILGNFLCKKYTIVNFVLFKGFMLVPFLFELRAVMDWIWTDTSMTIMDWFKMEDIFASIYQIKCMRGMETDFPQPRGEKKTQMSKYLAGGGALCVIIGLIWFPLLLFALGGTVGVSNLPYEVSMKIAIGPYEPIYSMSAQTSSIMEYKEEEFKNFTDLYTRDKAAITFLENYINTDVAIVKLSTSSGKLWDISPPDKTRLIKELDSSADVVVHIEWTVSRTTNVKDLSGITTSHHNVVLLPTDPTRRILADMLTVNELSPSNSTIIIPYSFPKFLKVTSKTTDVVRQLMKLPSSQSLNEEDVDTSNEKHLYRNISLQLSIDRDCCAHQQWWVIQEVCDDRFYLELLQNIPLNDCKEVTMFLFNDKVFPEGLSFISGFGILGLYTTAVIVISQMMRKVVSDMAPKIMFDDLPYVDRILRLCLDIYLVRESGDLCLEEDLFAKLIFLYRSPETLIRWTRLPEEGERTDNEDQDEEEDVNEAEERETRERPHRD